MKATVLVTGCAGFIGSNFVHYLTTHYPDYRIIGVDALTYAGSVENLPATMLNGSMPDRACFHYGNVCNGELISSLTQEADFVVHFAAETHVTRSIHDNRLFFETDVMGTHSVANAVLKHHRSIRRFIHISTSEVYGTALTPAMAEEHPLNPMSPYAGAKCGADRLVYSYWHTYRQDFPLVIVRPFNNYGPRQHLEKVIPRFITSGILGEPMTVHGDGMAARDFIHVHDVCRALDKLLHAPAQQVVGEVFNVASGEDRTILSLAEDIQQAMNVPHVTIEYCGNRPGQVMRHTGDWQKIHRVVDWSPLISWNQGLQETIQWYRDNRDWWEKQRWLRSVLIRTADGKMELH